MRGLASFNSGDVWRCPCCHTRNDCGDYCEECFATRDGHETVACMVCSDRHLAYGIQDHASFTCDACGGFDEDIRYHTETQNAA